MSTIKKGKAPKSARKRQRDDAIVILMLVSIIGTVAYILGGEFTRKYLLGAVTVVVVLTIVITITKMIANFINPTVTFLWNEFVYALFGIPFIIIGLFYFPVAIYMFFFSGAVYATEIKIVVATIAVIAQITSVFITFRTMKKDKGDKKIDEALPTKQIWSDIEVRKEEEKVKLNE